MLKQIKYYKILNTFLEFKNVFSQEVTHKQTCRPLIHVSIVVIVYILLFNSMGVHWFCGITCGFI